MQTKNPQPQYFICSLTTRAVRRMIAYYNQTLEPLGLTAQQVMALGVLWQEDGISLGEFSRQAGMGKAAAVTMIQRLENMGLVAKTADPTDGRLNVLNLTRKARAMGSEILSAAAALEKNIERAVGKEDMAGMIRGLRAIRDMEF
ncbi:MarR family transcriptional regulator [uncultured Desulfosarcina sp.]|uniref:MarR family winged helix-turn-helix transcriptional regulator n=1 Tax=uncultured Desulfosarcina sp. TaxID=218289 RepID=UPI0029C7DD89|nr:MarR family transcriptional regulator [uncultured Desulfosarcina sp.]